MASPGNHKTKDRNLTKQETTYLSSVESTRQSHLLHHFTHAAPRQSTTEKPECICSAYSTPSAMTILVSIRGLSSFFLLRSPNGTASLLSSVKAGESSDWKQQELTCVCVHVTQIS